MDTETIPPPPAGYKLKTTIPPPPAGYTLKTESSAIPPPPAGYTLKSAIPPPPVGYVLKTPDFGSNITPQSEALATAANKRIAAQGITDPAQQAQTTRAVISRSQGQPVDTSIPSVAEAERSVATGASTTFGGNVAAGVNNAARETYRNIAKAYEYTPQGFVTGKIAQATGLPMPSQQVPRSEDAPEDTSSAGSFAGRMGFGAAKMIATAGVGGAAVTGGLGAVEGAGAGGEGADQARLQGRQVGGGQEAYSVIGQAIIRGLADYLGAKAIPGRTMDAVMANMGLNLGQQVGENVVAKTSGVDPDRSLSQGKELAAATGAAFPLGFKGIEAAAGKASPDLQAPARAKRGAEHDFINNFKPDPYTVGQAPEPGVPVQTGVQTQQAGPEAPKAQQTVESPSVQQRGPFSPDELSARMAFNSQVKQAQNQVVEGRPEPVAPTEPTPTARGPQESSPIVPQPEPDVIPLKRAEEPAPDDPSLSSWAKGAPKGRNLQKVDRLAREAIDKMKADGTLPAEDTGHLLNDLRKRMVRLGVDRAGLTDIANHYRHLDRTEDGMPLSPEALRQFSSLSNKLLERTPTPAAPEKGPNVQEKATQAKVLSGRQSDVTTPRVGEEPAAASKQPWQMTREEFASSQGKPADNRYVQQQRDAIVKQALSEGRPVPPEVLKDYPDLQKTAPPAQRATVSKEGATAPEFTVRPAKYAKGRMIVEAPSDNGIKSRAAIIAEKLGGKYVNREGGYNMSEGQAIRFQEYFKKGYHEVDFSGSATGRDPTAPAPLLGTDAQGKPISASQLRLVDDKGNVRGKPEAKKADPAVAQFRKQAQTLAKTVEEKRRPMTQNATPKRMREYRHRTTEADLLDRVKTAYERMADAREAGTLPKELEGIRSRAQVEALVKKKMKTNGGYYDAYYELPEFESSTPAAKALQEMIEPRTAERKAADAAREKQRKIQDLEDRLRYADTPGFFPTPKPLAERLVEAADIQPGMKVLEPSAGKGDLLDAIKTAHPDAKATGIEYSDSIAEIAKLKGHDVEVGDFLKSKTKADRIVMNPPFERGQDIDHVRHAYESLNPDGKLVAVMSEGAFGRSDKKATEFREWLQDVGGISKKVESGSFSGVQAFRQTGVATRVVEIRKAAASPAPPRTGPRNRGVAALPASVTGPERVAGAFAQPEAWWNTLHRKFAYEFAPVERVQKEIEKSGGKITEESNVAERLTTYAGRERARNQAIEREHVEPVKKLLRAAGYKAELDDQGMLRAGAKGLPDIDKYLIAKHASERNATIAERNPDNPSFADGGIGMTNSTAADIINKVSATIHLPRYEKIAEAVYAMNRETLKRRRDAGLITQKEYEVQSEQWDYYVPARTDMEAEGMPASFRGRGFNVRGKESQSALGRTTEADSPLTWSILQAMDSVHRAEQNRVTNTLAKMLKDNPSPDEWEIHDKLPEHRVLNSKGEAVDAPDFRFADNPNVVAYKEAGVPKYIEFKTPEAAQMATAVKRLNVPQMTKFDGAVRKFNNYFRAITTGKNPPFFFRNPPKDAQAALFNLSADYGAKTAVRALSRWRKSFSAMYDVVGDHASKPGNKYHDYAREFIDNGGSVGGFAHGSFDEIQKDLVKSVSQTGNRAGIIRFLRAADAYVDRVGSAQENATRLAAYAEMREIGKTPQQAAAIAKRLTVDFDRKGEFGRKMNLYWVYSNAGVQGNVEFLRRAILSPRGRKIAGGIVAGATAYYAALPAMLGKDEEGRDIYDQFSESEKDRNLIIPAFGMLGGNRVIKIPLGYGVNTLFTLGRKTAEAATGRATVSESAMSVGSSLLNAFNPLGSGDNLTSTLSPTLLKPVVEIAMNKNWANRQIVPDQKPFGAPVPDSELKNRDTTKVSQAVASGLNTLTGGDEVTPGLIDVSPATLDHWGSFLTGGIGRFVSQISEVPGKAVGKDLSIRDVPIASSFVTEPPKNADAREFYDTLRASEDALADLKHYEQTGQTDKAAKLKEHRKKEIEFARWADRRRDDIADIRKGGGPDAEKKMGELARDFNRAYRSGNLPPVEAFKNELADLRAKKKAGTISATDRARLAKLERFDARMEKKDPAEQERLAKMAG